MPLRLAMLILAVVAADGSAQSHADAPKPVGASASVERAGITVLGRSQTRPTTSQRDDRTGVLVGTLLFTRVRAEIVDAPVAEALRAFGEALGVPMLPLYAEQAGDPGLDPSRRVTVQLDDATAREALEAIVVAAMDQGGSWQINRGRLEVGPKWILARASARACVTIPVRDLLLEPPNFTGSGPSGAALFSGSLRQSIAQRFPDAVVNAMAGRSTPEFVATQLIAEIEAKVEPDAWLVDEAQRSWLLRTGEAANPLARAGQWAALTYRDGQLVLTAPDFVLRGIRGYDGVVPPALDATTPEPRAQRSRVSPPHEPRVEAADGATIELLGFAPSDRGASRTDPALVALGALVHSRVNVLLAGATARSAIESLAAATGATIRPIWAKMDAPPDGVVPRAGIDSEKPLHLELADASGLEALEIILELAGSGTVAVSGMGEGGGAECTWQLVGGAVECGPKATLARKSARRSVVYDVASLLLEPPYSIAPPWLGFGHALQEDRRLADVVTPLEQQFGPELGAERNRHGKRKSPRFIAAELLLLFEKHIEPRAWLPSDEQIETRLARGKREVDPLDRQGEWAQAISLDGKLVVNAPDFVHRAIGGYAPLPSPAESAGKADGEERP